MVQAWMQGVRQGARKPQGPLRHKNVRKNLVSLQGIQNELGIRHSSQRACGCAAREQRMSMHRLGAWGAGRGWEQESAGSDANRLCQSSPCMPWLWALGLGRQKEIITARAVAGGRWVMVEGDGCACIGGRGCAKQTRPGVPFSPPAFPSKPELLEAAISPAGATNPIITAQPV